MSVDMSPRRMLQHETTNKVSNIQATIQQARYGDGDVDQYLSDDAPDDALRQFLDAYDDAIETLDDEPIDERYMERIDETSEYFTDELYQDAREIGRLTSCLNAYLEQKHGEADDASISLEHLVAPLENAGSVIEYDGPDPDDRVAANEGLRLLTSTVRKNWYEHGHPEGDTEPRLHTTITDEGKTYQIDIWDNGPGMAEETFNDAVNEKPKAGLGLFMGDHLADLYDGSFDRLAPDEITASAERYLGDPGAGIRITVPAYETV